MLMRPSKGQNSCPWLPLSGDCLGDMTVRMRKVLVRLWVGVRVCHLRYCFLGEKLYCP